MVTIILKRLACIQTSRDGGNDDVYMKLVVDGQKVQRWPDRGQCGMGIGGDAFPNLQLSFNENVKLELWEHDTTSEHDYMGSYLFTPGSGSGQVTLADAKQGSIYVLYYEYPSIHYPHLS
jgi:hypothetical protein